MATANWTKIKEKTDEMKDRIDRMREDNKVYNGEKYTLTDSNNQTLKEYISVTLPYARLYIDFIIGLLSTVSLQPRVEGIGLSDKTKGILESFYINILMSILKDQERRNQPSMVDFAAFQIGMNGTIAQRNTLHKTKDGVWIPRVLGIDAPNIYYEFGPDGLDWASAEFTRSASVTKALYPKYESKVPQGKEVKTTEFWDSKVREVYFGENFIFSEINKYKKPPFVIVEGSVGSQYTGEDYYKNKSDSLFAGIRELIDEMNRSMSITETIEWQAFNAALLYPNPEGGQGEFADNPYKGRQVIPVGENEKLIQVPIQDVYNTTRLNNSKLQSLFQQMTVPALAYGNLSIPISSITVTKLLSSINAKIGPRLKDMNSFISQTVRMFRDFYVEGSYETSLGKEGIEIKYTPDELSPQHFITYELSPEIPEESLANVSLSQAMINQSVPLEYAWDKGLKVQDVHALMVKKTEQDYRMIDPTIMMIDQVFNFRDAGDLLSDPEQKENKYFLMRIVLDKLKRHLAQIAAGQRAPVNTGEQKGSGSMQPMLPLFQGGGGATPGSEGESLPPEEEEGRVESRATTVRRQTEAGE